jgi:hypothetical protein
MSSQAWTEIAIGSEARSFWRFSGRVIAPSVLRSLLVVVGAFIVVWLLGEAWDASFADPRPYCPFGHCDGF